MHVSPDAVMPSNRRHLASEGDHPMRYMLARPVFAEVFMRTEPRLTGARRFSWQLDLCLIILAFVVLFGFFAPPAYNRRSADHAGARSAAERVQPVTNQAGSGVVRRTVRSGLFQSVSGRDIENNMVQLTSTRSVRNVSPRFPVVIESVG